ncbi:amino acid ABC transporter permease [Erysipelatoclostridium sp. AM42-17]|uniref:amino acid ABC transporter permease n=1 Tax=Erysipelatoclostridium sp. AM42-17 TaxID=2293102 RepID=UPI000E4A2B2B|nr:amino acid ABC transporter permease [Erysipelatoclostridium sp. AM42-17]RHS95820.1 amino acid ABC transporter permease [Erysipelatoclostridium sp. AM42-17]
MQILLSGFSDALGQLPAFIGSFLKVSLVASLFAMIISLIIGVILGLMGTSKHILLKGISRAFVELFQNTPILILLFFLYAFSPYIFGKTVDAMTIGTIVLGVYHGAYMCEIVRSGIESIPKGQSEAALSQGFSYVDTMRYIILPQALRKMVPSLTTQIVGIVKNSSILQCIAVADLMYQAEVWTSYSGHCGPAYIIAAMIYFIACYPLTCLSRYLENKVKEGYATKKVKKVRKEKIPGGVENAS